MRWNLDVYIPVVFVIFYEYFVKKKQKNKTQSINKKRKNPSPTSKRIKDKIKLVDWKEIMDNLRTNLRKNENINHV